jgi:hypothetical protein
MLPQVPAADVWHHTSEHRADTASDKTSRLGVCRHCECAAR